MYILCKMADAEEFSDRSLAIVESLCRPFLTEITADNLESAKTALTSLLSLVLLLTLKMHIMYLFKDKT